MEMDSQLQDYDEYQSLIRPLRGILSGALNLVLIVNLVLRVNQTLDDKPQVTGGSGGDAQDKCSLKTVKLGLAYLQGSLTA